MINILLAATIAAVTVGLIMWTDYDYGDKGALFKTLYLVGGIYCIIKWIPWDKKD